MNIQERIDSGKLFTGTDKSLIKNKKKCRKILTYFNRTNKNNLLKRYLIMTKLFGNKTNAWIEPPFYCSFGYNITIGKSTYINYNCSFVDEGKIKIGKNVLIGAVCDFIYCWASYKSKAKRA